MAVLVLPVTAAAAALAAAALHWKNSWFKRRGSSSDGRLLKMLEPQAELNKDGSLKHLQPFGVYVVQQVGLEASHPVAPLLAKVAEKYVRGDKTSSDTSREDVVSLAEEICSSCNEGEKQVANDLVEELDSCILAYFAFHWQHAADVLNAVINSGKNTIERRRSSLKKAVLQITRSQRYNKLVEVLGPQRRFNTLLEQLKGLHCNGAETPGNGEAKGSDNSEAGDLVIPAEEEKRSPVVLFVGGGMGAGKSTVVRDVMQSPFWKKVAPNAVVVEADAFKEKDVVYRALSEQEGGANPETAALVHSCSVKAALSLFVAAVNEGRDIVFDGTMSWEPFVRQCVDMVRNAHKQRYRVGPGYCPQPDGSVIERYWEPIEQGESPGASVDDLRQTGGEGLSGVSMGGDSERRRCRRPYRIEMVGVACDAGLSVVRGMRRAILTGRGVPVEGQLRSHRLFAASVENYAAMVDRATLYMTNSFGGEPDLIALKDGPNRRLLVDPPTYAGFRQLRYLNDKASCVADLYGSDWGLGCGGGADTESFGGAWSANVLSSSRRARQERLLEGFWKMDVPSTPGRE